MVFEHHRKDSTLDCDPEGRPECPTWTTSHLAFDKQCQLAEQPREAAETVRDKTSHTCRIFIKISSRKRICQEML